MIIDVTCPFENGADAFQRARTEKYNKYNSLMNEMMAWRRFSRVTVEPFVVGSLGSWDPRNDSCLK